jgi:hypothetical protein
MSGATLTRALAAVAGHRQHPVLHLFVGTEGVRGLVGLVSLVVTSA